MQAPPYSAQKDITRVVLFDGFRPNSSNFATAAALADVCALLVPFYFFYYQFVFYVITHFNGRSAVVLIISFIIQICRI